MAENIGNSDDQVETTEKSVSTRLVQQTMEYQGSIPPPAMLADFDKIIPNGADRIMQMAEKDQQHKMHLETKQLEILDAGVKKEHTETVIGQVCAFVLSVSFVTAGTYLALNGQVGAGLASIAIVGLGRIVSVFVTRNKN